MVAHKACIGTPICAHTAGWFYADAGRSRLGKAHNPTGNPTQDFQAADGREGESVTPPVK